MLSPTLFLAALPLTSAHFLLKWPAARGFSDDNAATFPCGGFDSASTNRIAYPLSGAPIQLEMHHTEANVQVLLAVGNDPGSAYNIVLRPTFRERGPDSFCMGDVSIPASANLTAGMNATIQVVTNGDPSGGLYQVCDGPLDCSFFYVKNGKTDAGGKKVRGYHNHGSDAVDGRGLAALHQQLWRRHPGD